jgi:hypothetical protein
MIESFSKSVPDVTFDTACHYTGKACARNSSLRIGNAFNFELLAK